MSKAFIHLWTNLISKNRQYIEIVQRNKTNKILKVPNKRIDIPPIFFIQLTNN